MLTRAQAARQRRELWRDIGREERRQAREKIARLRAAVRESRARRTVALREAKAQCRADRLAARQRAQELRARIASELGQRIAAERGAALEECARQAQRARAIPDDVERARAELAAERQHKETLRDIQRRGEADFAQAVRAVETDADVHAQIAPPLRPLFDQVKDRIEALPDASRTEAFLKHAADRPDDVLAAMEHPAELELRARQEEHAAAVREYEQRKAARAQRMRSRAARLRGEAEGAERRTRQLSDAIPLGQPILVGHHSEKRHRRDIRRIEEGLRKSFQLRDEAKALERRASAAETNRAISSDDPDAVAKLRAKLEELESSRARMVAANRAVRSRDPRAALASLGFAPKEIDDLLTPDFAGRKGFPGYALQNAAGEARRLRQRIEDLTERARRAPPSPMELGGARVDEAHNRVRIFFPDKPADALRRALRGAGFRFSRTAGAWQRHASPQAWFQARRILTAGGTP
jgi:hypothetical protein